MRWLVESEIGRWPALRKQRQFSCRISSVIALWDVNFGDRDHQNVLSNLNYFCGDFF